jgi:hypothetical protein
MIVMLISTRSSVFHLESDASETDPTLLMENIGVRRVSEGEKISLVALGEGTVIVLEDGDERRIETGIEDRIDSLCIVNEKPLDLLLGTTPPYLYRLEEESPATRVKTFDELSVREKWYTPWGGPAAVRSLAKSGDGWIYADIHVGSIMRSPDKGVNWEPVTPTLHVDVHEVNVTPASNERVYANTYHSVYVSDDRGDSWDHRSNVLNNRYGRGIAIHPYEPDVVLCGVSDGPSGSNVHGELYRSEDAGLNWVHISDGFPESTKKNIDTFHIAFWGRDVAWVCDENTLYLSRDKGMSWEAHWKAPEEITLISCLSG